MKNQTVIKTDMTVRDYDINDLVEGMSVNYTTMITKKDVGNFAKFSGDINPIHVDENFGNASDFGNNLVHGMLISSHFSTLIGVFLPGQNALLSGVNMDFIKHVPVGSEVTVSASITTIQRMKRMIVLRLLAFVDETICVRGEAKVKVLPSLTSHSVKEEVERIKK